ncbi:MAG: hypothetical protein RMK18_06875 [Armatimonadota bacterium]|nr:hypothetical protein [Armatimonadota bacterium]MCX7777562.1 hypothetical protein [Armatimonadota bacterium]MDW8025571.1 hypothetical protein [Armatimonadota bacterium]
MAQEPEVTPTQAQQAEAKPPAQPRAGASFLWGFILGLIIGGAAMTAVLVQQWYIPLQSEREERASLQDQLTRLQEVVAKANETRRQAELAAEQISKAFRELQDALSKLGIQLPEAAPEEKPVEGTQQPPQPEQPQPEAQQAPQQPEQPGAQQPPQQ